MTETFNSRKLIKRRKSGPLPIMFYNGQTIIRNIENTKGLYNLKNEIKKNESKSTLSQ